MNRELLKSIGIDEEAGVSEILVNEASRSVIAVMDVVVAPDWQVKRLYYRRFDETSYRPVQPISPLESQDDAHNASGSSGALFLSKIWTYRTEIQSWSSSRPDIWRLNLHTGKRELVMKVDDISVSMPCIRVILSALNGVKTDESGAFVTLGVARKDDDGVRTKVDYGIFDLDFASANAVELTSLPNVFL